MDVTLIDGRVVDSASEQWLWECLARHVLAKPFDERRAWIESFEQRNKEAPLAGDTLRGWCTTVHFHQRAQRIEAGRQLRESANHRREETTT